MAIDDHLLRGDSNTFMLKVIPMPESENWARSVGSSSHEPESILRAAHSPGAEQQGRGELRASEELFESR